MTVFETARQIAYFKFVLTLLPDTNDIFKVWERLVTQYQVLGKQVYDARLVAAMSVHNLTHLLTFNTGDFKRFKDITAVSPTALLSNEQSE